jgi:integrase
MADGLISSPAARGLVRTDGVVDEAWCSRRPPDFRGNWFREVCDAAGLKNCSAHGWSKAATRRLIEAGVSTKAGAAITGHQTLRRLEVYQVPLADAAIGQLERTDRERDLANLETG